MDARARAHLHDVVGGADGVLVVLHHDDRVADVAQAFERRDHLHVVFRMQADARLVEHVEHPHQPGADLRGQADALRLAAGKRAGAPVEAQIVEPDAQQQFQPAADLAQHLPAGVRAAAGRLDRAEKRVQFVEVELADLVDGLALDGEQQPGGPDARAVAIGAGVLHHHLVEPGLHPGTGFAALPVAAVVPLDAPRDSAEADLLAFRVFAFDLRLGRHADHDLLAIEPVQDRVAHRSRAASPRAFRARSEAPSTGCTSPARPRCPGCI